MKKNPKAKALMYVQQLDKLPLGESLYDTVEKELRPNRWAAIIHDKDVNEDGEAVAPHIHLMMVFENARHISSVSKILKDKPQYLEIWKGKTNNGFSYLIHETNGAKDSYKYSPLEVTANFDYLNFMASIEEEISQASKYKASKGDENKWLDMLLAGIITKEQLLEILSGSQYAKLHRQIDDVDGLRLQKEAEKWRKDMYENKKAVTVIWIYGESATGKTRFAKEHAKKSGQSFYVTGSNRDPWQNYRGEHTVILDELRPNIIPFQELLRLLDPFGYDTNVMGGSRFRDKEIVADLIIVTSPFNPIDFYNASVLNTAIDKKSQLLRRLTLIIHMTKHKIIPVVFSKTEELSFALIDDEKNARFNNFSEADCSESEKKSLELFESIFEGGGVRGEQNVDKC